MYSPPLSGSSIPRGSLAATVTTGAETVWLWLVVVPLAAVLRFLFLSHKSLWLDESASVFLVRVSRGSFFRVLWQGEFNMALYYALLRPVLHAGDTEFWLRLPAVLAGVAAIPAMFALGKAIFDRRIGLLAALLMAVNSCHVVYSQEARGYSLLILFSTLSSLYFLKMVEKPTGRYWLPYAITSALAVYSHFFAGLVLLAQWSSLAAIPRQTVAWKKPLLAVAATCLLCSPAMVFVLTRNTGQLGWVQKPNLLELYHTAVFLAAEQGKAVGKVVLVFCLAGLVLSGRDWRRASREGETATRRWRHTFLWFWLVMPVVLMYVVSLMRAPLFAHRFLIICLPPFVLLVTRGLTSLRTQWVIPVFVVLCGITVGVSYTQPREDWRGATRYVLAHAQRGDAIYFFQPYGKMPFEYYVQHSHGEIHPASLTRDAITPSSGYGRLWVVLYPAVKPDASTLGVQAGFAAQYPLLEEADQFRAVRLLLFDLRRAK